MDTRFTGDIHLSTRQAADGDKLDFWLSEVDRLLVRVECDRRPEERLEASLDWQDFGLLRMATIRANQHAVTRSGHSLSRDGRDSIFACLMLQGEGFSHQGVECARHGPGDVVLYDTARPYGHGFPADMAMAVLDIPRPLFQEQVGVWNERGLVRIERTAGMDALAAHRLLRGGEAARRHLASQLLEWLHSLWSARLGLPASRSTLCSLWRAKAYIERHLAEDDLDCERISRAVGVSARQLARIFEQEGESVTRHLWGRRLERCRVDLADPALRHLSVSELAFRWGFNHIAHFCRSYKRRYGETPSHTRAEALAARVLPRQQDCPH